jgi:glycosyltransferase involved in cell wall biosynthesis
VRVAFVWHWYKRTNPELAGTFAAEDTLIKAIGRLVAEGEQAVIFALAREPYAVGRTFSERQGIWYTLVPDRETLLNEVRCFDPDAVFLNHHPYDYDDILQGVAKQRAKKAIYYSAPVSFHSLIQTFDAFLVHHPYQAEQLIGLGMDAHKIHIVPKTADLDCFYPNEGTTKKWDCIYPTRGGFGYWKRIELAVESCRLIGATIVLPGAAIPGTLNTQPSPLQKRVAQWFPRLWQKSASRIGKLHEFPWVTTLSWQSPEELNIRYNQSRCLVITSDDNEMGPRVIPEAAACNLPIVCCSDSRACVSHANVLGGLIAEPEPRDIASKIKLALSSTPNSRQLLLEAGLDTWVIYRVLRKLLEEWGH